jgi:hypothetical protein
MSLFNRFYGKRRTPVSLDLGLLMPQFGAAVSEWEDRDVDHDLLRAQFADAFRDAGLVPVDPSRFTQAAAVLSGDAARRFAVSLAAFALPETVAVLSHIVALNGDSERMLLRLKESAQSLALLTPSILRQSDVRLEEFARHFCECLQVGIQGEAPEKSVQRLREIDYARLVAEAEQAKMSAEERMAYLRKLQEQEEGTRRPRRGKW